MNKWIKVLSLFDGIACWYEALQRAGIKIDKYFASEIDKYAIQTAMKNHPDIIQIWDVQKVRYSTPDRDNGWEYLIADWETVWEWPIDLLIWGSPCQWFSVAGKQLAFEDPRSKLFFEYVRLLNEVKPKYFLLENVRMKQERVDIISWYLWVQPIEINSSLVSGQNRKRLYRTNIPWVIQPADKWILLKDILQDQVDEKYYYSKERRDRIVNWKYDIVKRVENKDWKCATLTTVWWWNHEKKVEDLIFVGGGELRIKQATKLWYIVAKPWDWINLSFPNSTTRRWRVIRWKSSTLVVQWDAFVYDKVIRKLTPVECERLQTLPDNYTEGVSDSQRYKMLWNGRTVDVIAHIFSFLDLNY